MRHLLVPAAVSTMLAWGCSSDDSAAENWAGSWDRTGSQSDECGGASTSEALGGTVTISLGSSSGTFVTSTTCGLAWDVTGNGNDSAALAPGSCSVPVQGADVAVAFASGSATLDSSTITSTASGTSANGCTITQRTTLTRVSVPPQGSR